MKIETLQDIPTEILRRSVIVFESSEPDPETGRKGRYLKLIVRSIQVVNEKWEIEIEEAINLPANRISNETSITISPSQFKLISSHNDSHLFVREVKNQREFCCEISIEGLNLVVDAA